MPEICECGHATDRHRGKNCSGMKSGGWPCGCKKFKLGALEGTVVKVSLHDVPMNLLVKINATGLYGITLEQTAEILLLDRIREFLKPDSILLELPKVVEKLKPGRKRRRSK